MLDVGGEPRSQFLRQSTRDIEFAAALLHTTQR